MYLIKKFFFIFLLLGSVAQAKLDDSVDIFFPKSLQYLQYSQNEFSVFWWSFAIINPEQNNADFAKAKQLCQDLQTLVGKEIRSILCGDNIKSFIPSLVQWSEDYIRREPAPPLAAVINVLQSSLGEIGFLNSINREIFLLKRQDPSDQWQVYLEKTQSLSGSAFKREHDFLIEIVSKRILIPIQFSQKPQMKNALNTQEIIQKYAGVVLVGPHASAYTNEKQVHEDMEIVSIVGALVLVLFIGFLVFKGRVSALLLFPPVALSLGLAAFIVDLVFGSIHGLTLAFGSGIVGLAVDYGLHGAFNAGSKQTWKSNAVGFLTTLTGLAVMVMSGIPLIRQMMFFAVLGLFFGFIIFYFLCKYVPRYFTMKSISFPSWNFKWGHWVVMGFISLGILSLFKTNLSFDLRKINFQLPEEKIVSEWFFKQGGEKENYLLLRDWADFGPQVLKESFWAEGNRIQYAGLGHYWPENEKIQTQNIQSWHKLCPQLNAQLSKVEKKVFSPFLDNVCDLNNRAWNLSELSQREYSNHLVGRKKFISILTAQNEEQAKLIRERFPQAKSLMESIKGFSNSLEQDLRWMIPLVFVLSTFILFIYYKSAICVLTAYIPFFTGLGLFFLVNQLRGHDLDLISVLGLLMVFGFSLDYGVFATDIYKFPQAEVDESAVYSALGLAAMSNIIGFFPMVFAKHPVLHQLGTALFFGTIGTYLGTIWGIEKLYHWRKLI